MKCRAAALILHLAVCLPGVAADMRSTAYEVPQYQTIRLEECCVATSELPCVSWAARRGAGGGEPRTGGEIECMFLRGWKKKGVISENYSAITGEGDDPRLSSDQFYSWEH